MDDSMVIQIILAMSDEVAEAMVAINPIPDMQLDPESQKVYDSLRLQEQIAFTMAYGDMYMRVKAGRVTKYEHEMAMIEVEKEARRKNAVGELRDMPDYKNWACPNCLGRHICWPDVWSEDIISWLFTVE